MNAQVRTALAPYAGSFLLFDPPVSLVLELSRLERLTLLTAAFGRRRAAGRCRDRLGTEQPGREKVSLVLATADDPPFPPRTFDALVCTAGVPRELEPLKALRVLRRLVRPSGVVLIVSRIREGAIGGVSSFLRTTTRHDPHPRATDLTAWMLRSGMRSVRQTMIPRTLVPTMLTWAHVQERPWED